MGVGSFKVEEKIERRSLVSLFEYKSSKILKYFSQEPTRAAGWVSGPCVSDAQVVFRCH